MDWMTVEATFHRDYALPAAEEAVTLSALEQYYLRQRDRQHRRGAQTQRLLQQLLEED
ncbi:hypothetical protein ACS4N0_10440 [Levilactobacillus zymae]